MAYGIGPGGAGGATGTVTVTYADKAYVFAFSAPLASTQPIKRVTLPSNSSGGQIHIFAIQLQ